MDCKIKLIEIGAIGRQEDPKIYKQKVRSKSLLDPIVYSDRPMDNKGNTVVRLCLYRRSQEIFHDQFPLEIKVEVHDVEIMGATARLRAACSHIVVLFATNDFVCLDN